MKRIILLLLYISLFSFSDDLETIFFFYGDTRIEYLSGSKSPNFRIGDTDILGITNVGDFEILMEIFIEQPDNFVDFERLYIRWQRYGLFRITMGKFHPALGYASTKWHHGLHLMTITDRPQIINFEDEGGPLIAHGVGVKLDGVKKVGKMYAGYVVDIINGNLHFGSDNSSDYDKYKSVVSKIYIKPSYFSEVGISFAYDPTDVLHSDPAIGSVNVINRITAISMAYDKPGGFEFIGEYFITEELISDKKGKGGFFLISYPFFKGKGIYELRPFFMFDFIDWEEGNVWFEKVSLRLKIEEEEEEHLALSRKNAYTIGFKLSLSPFTALKLSATYEDRKYEKDLWHTRLVFSFMIPAGR